MGKLCSKCGLADKKFHKDASRKDGLDHCCTDCRKEAKQKLAADAKAAKALLARDARIASDQAPLEPGDLSAFAPTAKTEDGYVAPSYSREKRQEYNKHMGEFAVAARELSADPEKLAAFVSLTAEQERRWLNKRLGRAMSLGAAREMLLARQFEQIAERVRWPVPVQGFAAHQKHSPSKRAIVAPLSDLHFGALLPAYENPVAYDFLRASRSLAHVVQAVADYKSQYRDQTECVLVWNGDEFEGLLGWNDMDNAPLSEQMVAVGQAAVYSIAYLASHFPRVRVIKRGGNHGRNKLRHEGRATSSKWDSFETVVFKFVAMQCKSLPNVTFDIARSPVAVVPLFDQNMLVLHGDTELPLKAPSSSGGKKSWEQSLAAVNADQRYGAHIALLVAGHFHDPDIMIFEKGAGLCQGALTPPNGHARTGGYSCVTGQFIFEAVPGHALGDNRFIRTGPTQYGDSSLDSIIPAFYFDAI